ncbi:hypothetical protein GOB98_10540 [Sinorhizobium meliloti]|nr:hypothetical protein [Sinorhizobium meliloti]MDW9976527.1 hypothetical protein [Sinorhizobium meliloti]MDX0293249.1 hypothetical protein [Sinorhizobium meliloti]
MRNRTHVALILSVALNLQPANAADIDEIKHKIEEITAVLEIDASKYEKSYPGELELIVRYRLGWAWLVDLSDERYALEVLQSSIRRLAKDIDYVSQSESSAGSGGLPPDINIVKSNVVTNNDVLIALETAMKNERRGCSNAAAEQIGARVPLSEIVSIQAPDIGTFPSLHHDPTLRVKFIITDDGKVSLAPDVYAPGNGNDARGKHAIPGIASTVSGALVLLAAEKFGAFGGATSFSASFAAAAAAGLVYYTAVQIQSDIEQGELADAVEKMNKAISRIYQAQKTAYLGMAEKYGSVILDVCRKNFGTAYDSQSLELDRLSHERQALMDKFSIELKRLKSAVASESWEDVECAVFGCDGGAKSTIVMPLDQLVRAYVKRLP